VEALLDWFQNAGFQLGQTLQGQLHVRSFASIFVVFAGGVLTSFTPCVYPMIPVTVSYIGGAAGGSRKRAVGLSLVYVSGLALVYAALGIAAGMLGRVFGQFTRSPWIYGSVGLIVILFGLLMLELLPFQIPALFSGVQGRGARRGGYLGACMMGMAAGFVAAPCTAPVLGVLLAFVASTRDVLWGGTLLLVFAFGLGFLLMLLGIFSGYLASLPRAGVWMDRVKKAFGVAMLVVGAVFLWQAIGMIVRGGASG
jgi:thiol:disulfide interchange protein DsbD